MTSRGLIPWWRGERRIAERDPFAALHKEMNDVFERFLGGDAGGGMEGFSPRVDVTENDKEIKVAAELPGMEEKDLDVSVVGDVLTIKGEKKQEKEEKSEESYRLERSYGSFRRDLPLPCKVQVDKSKARFEKGVLAITLPKAAEAAASHKISVGAK
jgi:HSP20 family protein